MYASEFRPDPPCGPQDFLCFNALDELGHLLDTEVAVLGVVAGTVAIIAGSILASRSALWVHKARLLPTLSIGPRSGFAGLKVTF